MKNEILVLAVVSSLLASLAKADVDKVVGKSIQYSCQNSEIGDFEFTANLGAEYKIEFSADKFKTEFQDSEIKLNKFETFRFFSIDKSGLYSNCEKIPDILTKDLKSISLALAKYASGYPLFND